jgi:hypothetical protein
VLDKLVAFEYIYRNKGNRYGYFSGTARSLPSLVLVLVLSYQWWEEFVPDLKYYQA